MRSAEIVGTSIYDLIRSARGTQTPEARISRFASHEEAHANQIRRERPAEIVDYGISTVSYLWEYTLVVDDLFEITQRQLVTQVVGAFVEPRSGLESFAPDEQKRIAEAPGKSNMSGDRTWGDWAVWTMANQELIRQEWLDAIPNPFSESESYSHSQENPFSKGDETEPPGADNLSQEEDQTETDLPLTESDLDLAA